jgi:hypothetical protein
MNASVLIRRGRFPMLYSATERIRFLCHFERVEMKSQERTPVPSVNTPADDPRTSDSLLLLESHRSSVGAAQPPRASGHFRVTEVG